MDTNTEAQLRDLMDRVSYLERKERQTQEIRSLIVHEFELRLLAHETKKEISRTTLKIVNKCRGYESGISDGEEEGFGVAGAGPGASGQQGIEEGAPPQGAGGVLGEAEDLEESAGAHE